MRVTAYIHISRTGNPTTGVGKHVINMTRGLAAMADVQLSVLAARNELDANRQIPSTSRLHGFPVNSFPLPVRYMEQFWRRINFPPAEYWSGKADWLYSPAEAYVATSNARLAVTIHDVAAFEPDLPWSNTESHKRFRKSFGLMFQRMKEKDALFLTVSEFSRNRLSELLSIDLSKIAVVGNGVEEEFFVSPSSAQAWNVGDPNPTILIVGGINIRKGGEHVIRLAKLLLDKKSLLKIHVAGLHDAPMLAEALKLSNVTNLGFITDDQLLRATRGAAISMMLSRYEGFGIPALEAMAAGVPAVVSPHTALPEIAGDAGIMVQPADSQSIVEVCHRLIDDSVYRGAVISRGHANAARFHWSSCIQRLHETLSKQR